MEFCIIGDLHIGARNDLKVFHTHFRQFYDHFFDELESMGIDTIFILGDIFDRRKYINFGSLWESKQYFFDRLKERNFKVIALVGNHDAFLRESLSINSLELLLKEYDNISVVSTPTTIIVDNTTIDIIPWICKENQEQIEGFINGSKSDLCFGHFELAGFSMYKGIVSQSGSASDIFDKYELVCSGHYHTKSQKNNIVYVGSPYEITWQDYNDPKGFQVFNTETRKLTFHQNPFNYFIRIEYDDTTPIPILDKTQVENCFIKVIVVNKTDLYKYDQFIQDLMNKGCYDIKITEDITEYNDSEIDNDIDVEDTLDILSNYVENTITDSSTDKIKTFIKTLYIEAINLGAV